MRITSLILCFLLSVTAIAQQKQVQYNMTKEQYEVERKKIQDAINETQQQLDLIKNNKKATMSELRALQNKLADRQRLIGNINEQLGNIDNTIRSSSKEVGSLKQKLEQLKIRYAQSIRYAYETRSSYDMLAFLFSSNSFNDAMRRMKYLKKFREFRKQQVEQIRITQNQLQHKIGVLNAEKAQKDELLSTQVQQSQVLKQDADKTNNVIQELKGKESQLLKEIAKNKETARRVDKAIQYYIETEMAKAAKAAEDEAKRKEIAAAKANPAVKPAKTNPTPEPTPNPPSTRNAPKAEAPTLLLTPTDVALAANFEGNKGKLYWPVEKGYIIEHFGVHPHPVETKVEVDCPGINIQTNENAPVMAVYNGTVSKVFSITGSSWIVMIAHGNYFTVYNGLSSVAVKEGQEVSTRQVIGHVANNDENIPSVMFEIWKSSGKKGQIKLNPELWIGRAH